MPVFLGLFFIAFAGVSLCSVALSADAPYRRDISISYKVIDADRYEETYTNSTTILSEAAISAMSQTTLKVNEHFDEWVGVEAVNIKSDGRVLPVAAKHILVASGANAATLGIFEADVRTRTIIFPSVEVGDILTFSRTIRVKKAIVPGGIDHLLSVPPHARYGAVRIDLDAPAGMEFRISRQGFEQEVRDVAGRRLYAWTLSEQPYVVPERDSVSYFDYSPFIAFSSRASEEAIGAWFYSVASGKARPSPDIKRLAEKVTAGLAKPREQARAIHDYVSSKIRYFHIFIGEGGWVPHGADEVLANGFGDCKDHVTLMRAMLAAKGIAADYVLVTAGAPSYKIFDAPLSRYDHVLLYLPDLGVYADPTNAHLAFGVTPLEVAGKPVLHVGKAHVERRRAPELQAASEAVRVQAAIRVAADGRYSGSAVWEARSNQAALLRSQIGAGAVMAQWLERSGIRGTGSFDAPRASDHSEPFRISMKFDTETNLLPDAKSQAAYPLGPMLIGSPHLEFLDYTRANRRLDTLCYAQNFQVIVDIELHESLAFGQLPLPVQIETEYGAFSATYSLIGKGVRVERTWRLQPPAMTCSSAAIKTHIMPLVNAMRRDQDMRLDIRRAGAVSRPL